MKKWQNYLFSTININMFSESLTLGKIFGYFLGQIKQSKKIFREQSTEYTYLAGSL